MSDTAAPERIERTMIPFGNTVVVEPLPDFDPLSKIILPEGRRVRYDRAKRAKVIDCGPDVRGLLPGMEILIAPMHDGVEINVPGTADSGRVRVIDDRAVMMILSPQPTPEAVRGALRRVMEAANEHRISVETVLFDYGYFGR